ncbi:hypothetical protein [Clavibacter capsici]|uniref:Uncharacterized protein n=1 Tax=Clavibacter capsici TaxID=1874630 RepID=A0AAE6XRB8_9MICO|nr:hypothetical protein [Clavibacter capsici]QIS45543.1 hypothetical protein GW570_10795 [Clavibacter capsici]
MIATPRQRVLTSIPYSRYKSAVRKFDRTSILELCAQKSAELDSNGDPASASWPFTAWALLDIARVAVVFGKPAGPAATMDDIARLCELHFVIEDPSTCGDSAGATGALLRLMAEQFSWQTDVLSSFARTLLLFSPDAPWPDGKPARVMTESWFEKCFGVDLETYAAAVFIAYAAASANEGRIDLGWVGRAPIKDIFSDFPVDALTSTIRNHLFSDTASVKQENREAESRAGASMLKYAFNPLINRPFISNGPSHALTPSPRAVVNKVSPNAIFYTAMKALGDDFAADLGHVFEAYIGRQLKSLPACTIEGEVAYTVGKTRFDSIDWFMQLDDVIVFVECKAVRPTEPVRLGRPQYAEHLQRQVGKGIEQLNRTNHDFDIITAVNKKLNSGLPRIGLVVTAEDHYGIGLPPVRASLPLAQIPTVIISARELEQLVALTPQALNNKLNAARMACQSDHILEIKASLPDGGMPDNAILISAFESFKVMRAVEAASSPD